MGCGGVTAAGARGTRKLVVLTGSAGGSLPTCEDVTTASTTGSANEPNPNHSEIPFIMCREPEETRGAEAENRATDL